MRLDHVDFVALEDIYKNKCGCIARVEYFYDRPPRKTSIKFCHTHKPAKSTHGRELKLVIN